jgi:Protein of unknown function (DUF2815)
MSASQQTLQLTDDYLLSQSCAIAQPQNIVLDPQFGNVRLTTPIGRLSYVTVIKPRSVQAGQEPKFSATILMNPAAVGDIWKAIVMVALNRWQPEQRPNPQNPSEMVTMTAEHRLWMPQEQGGLHNPLRNGNLTYSQDPVKYKAYLGTYTMNAGVDAVSRTSGASQQPLVLDEDSRPMDPSKMYSGAYGRLLVTIFAYPKAGTQSTVKPGVGVLLNAIQFARHGEKLSGFDQLKSAQAAFGTLPKDQSGAPQPGFGPNYGAPFAAPSGGIPAGFAAPPAQGQPQAQPQMAQQPVSQPAAQPGPAWQPPGAGAPGVMPWSTPAR